MAKIAPEVSDTIKTPVEVDQAQQPEQPETISGGHLVARALKAEGIDTIFTLCGGHIIEALEQRETELAERLVRQHALDLAAHVAANVHYLD